MSIESEFMVSVGFDALYGLEMLELTPEYGRARVRVEDHHKQPHGLVHGGVYAAIAESLASHATGVGVIPDGKIPSGISNQTSFLRPVTDGVIHATATRKHAGRTTWVWEVEMTDDQGRLCAITRMTVAIRAAEGEMRPPESIEDPSDAP